VVLTAKFTNIFVQQRFDFREVFPGEDGEWKASGPTIRLIPAGRPAQTELAYTSGSTDRSESPTA